MKFLLSLTLCAVTLSFGACAQHRGNGHQMKSGACCATPAKHAKKDACCSTR